MAAESHASFTEQLKITVTSELLEMNGSSFEMLNLSTADEPNENAACREYVVSAETLTNLTVLAKFLGFILARPFQYEFGLNAQVDSRQIEMRNKVREHDNMWGSREKSAGKILPDIKLHGINFILDWAVD